MWTDVRSLSSVLMAVCFQVAAVDKSGSASWMCTGTRPLPSVCIKVLPETAVVRKAIVHPRCIQV